jgi:hypothetical protein
VCLKLLAHCGGHLVIFVFGDVVEQLKIAGG